jgi:hypothetical protein
LKGGFYKKMNFRNLGAVDFTGLFSLCASKLFFTGFQLKVCAIHPAFFLDFACFLSFFMV